MKHWNNRFRRSDRQLAPMPCNRNGKIDLAELLLDQRSLPGIKKLLHRQLAPLLAGHANPS